MTQTLTIIDGADGTGLARIRGSDPGSDNAIEVFAFTGDTGALALAHTITFVDQGDGNETFSLAAGRYFFCWLTTLRGTTSVAAVCYGTITDGAPSDAPTGSISLAKQNLKAALADCATFRTWCGAVDRAAALARIYLEGLPKPPDGQKTFTAEQLEAYRPYATIYTDAKNGFNLALSSFGTHAEYDAAGKMCFTLFQNCPDQNGDDPTSDANLKFSNFCGNLIDELAILSGTAGYLCFDRLAFQGPYWTHPVLIPSEGLYQWCEISLDWKGS